MTKINKEKLYEKASGTCCWCYKKLTLQKATIEHLIDRSQGGTNRAPNLEIACDACNGMRSRITSVKVNVRTGENAIKSYHFWCSWIGRLIYFFLALLGMEYLSQPQRMLSLRPISLQNRLNKQKKNYKRYCRQFSNRSGIPLKRVLEGNYEPREFYS